MVSTCMHAQRPSPSREALRGRIAPWWALACKHSEAAHRLPLRRVHEHMALRRPFWESLVHSRLVGIVVGGAIEGHKDALGEVPDEARNSRHSEAITKQAVRGTQRQSRASIDEARNPRHSEAITSQHQRSSLAIMSGHQPTRAGRQPRGHHQRSSVVQLMVISLLGRVDSPVRRLSDGGGNQRPSAAISGHQPTRAGRQPRAPPLWRVGASHAGSLSCRRIGT